MPIDQALQVCGINAAPAIAAFTRDGFNNVADFAIMTDKDIRDMCVAMAARPQNQQGYKLGALQIKRVRAMAEWARQRARRQLPIPDDMFDAAMLNEAIQQLNMGTIDEAEVKKPPKLNPDDWDIWEPSFINYLKSLNGVQGTPLAYVIRKPNLTAADFPATDDINRLMYSVALQGPAFTRDNQRVARELVSFIAGTEAAHFIDQNNNDGRAMMTTLRGHYNGPGEVQKRYRKAEVRLQALHYRNEAVFPFSTFVAELTRCFTAYHDAQRPIDEETKMDYLMNKCLPPELAAAKEVARTSFPRDYIAAANHIGERISSIFGAAIANRERHQQGRGRRRVSNVNTRGGRPAGRGNRGGRFTRGGRGGRAGRGGRGGRGGYHPYHRDSRTTRFNNVDVSDPFRTFTDQEFSQMGRDGRAYVKSKREERNAAQQNQQANISAIEARISAVESIAFENQTQVSEVTTPTRATGAGAAFGRGLHQRGRGRGPNR